MLKLTISLLKISYSSSVKLSINYLIVVTSRWKSLWSSGSGSGGGITTLGFGLFERIPLLTTLSTSSLKWSHFSPTSCLKVGLLTEVAVGDRN